MNIKKGDNVQVTSGANRGKRAVVLNVDRARGRVLMDGINLVKKHKKAKREGEKGTVVILPRSVEASNVMLVCKSCDKAVRAGFRFEGETKVRYCKKCQSPL